MIELLSVFKEPSQSLINVLNVTCKSDPIYLKGRYIKLTRDVS